ncbi:MAG: hypothetical protein Q9184_004133 [Pyrenodesmia sp. 2 TL-2023]
MATSNRISSIHPGTFLNVPQVRRELQEVWDEYEHLTRIASRNRFRIAPAGPSNSRILVEDDDIPSDSEVDSDEADSQSKAMHWTEATTSQPPHQNAAESPIQSRLLKLPLELIDLILGHVLGERIIHIDDTRAIRTVHARHCLNGAGCVISRGPQFYLSTCSAPVSEEDALQEFHTQASSIPVDDNARWYVADAKGRHRTCRPWEEPNFPCNDPASASPWKHRFSILSVCRQVAARAFRIFWETNIFSFGEPVSFGRFLLSVNDMQLQKIRRIHMCIDVDNFVSRHDFDPAELRRLVSLDHLHISVHSLDVGFVGDMDSNAPSIRQIDLRQGEAAEFLRFEVLDIQRVSVIVYDSEEDFQEDHPGQTMDARFQLRFTLDQKRDLAKMVENTLSFDNNTRQVLAAKDRQIFEMEDLLKAMKHSLNVRYQVQRNEI